MLALDFHLGTLFPDNATPSSGPSSAIFPERVDPAPGQQIILAIQVYIALLVLYRSTALPNPSTSQLSTRTTNLLSNATTLSMASRFVENLDDVPITHPHLNVSLDDILAEERRKRSSSQSSLDGSETRRSGSSSAAMSPTTPTTESKIKRAFTIGGKKGRRSS